MAKKKPYNHNPRPVGELEMKDGGIMDGKAAHAFHLGFFSDAKDEEGRAYLDDLYKVATGQQVPPERMRQFQDDLLLDEKGLFHVEDQRRVLILSYSKDANGITIIDEPGTGTEVTMNFG